MVEIFLLFPFERVDEYFVSTGGRLRRIKTESSSCETRII